MAYSEYAQYTSADLGNVFIDLMGTVLTTITRNAELLVLVIIVSIVAGAIGIALAKVFGIFGKIKA